MSVRTRKPQAKALTLKDAFETEYARREMERRAREDAERAQQAQDLADAEQLFVLLAADPAFLVEHGLAADRRRYAVSLDHERFRISAYFEGGTAAVTCTDKRNASPGALPRRQETAQGVDETLRIIALFLVDETR